MERAVHELVAALGLPREDFDGYSLRIAGATELRAAHGLAGMDIIRSYERWGDGSDIAFIYARVTAAEQLRATAEALGGSAEGAAELETLVHGYVQPAIRR